VKPSPRISESAEAATIGDVRIDDMKVLLVEDDDSIAVPLVAGLEREGFDVTRTSTGAEALAADPGDLVLLDLRLPDVDGYQVCREMRARSEVPVIIVSARGEEVDRVVGLELGADDYLVKPIGLRELVARIRAVSRRSAARRDADADSISAGPVKIDLRAHRVTVDGNEVQLTGKEFDLLTVLARDAGAVVDRERLLREVWNTTWYGSAKTVDVHIASLRRKLGDPGLIETVRGIGLRFNA
jgi:DNA-binding response OmpR family regulator